MDEYDFKEYDLGGVLDNKQYEYGVYDEYGNVAAELPNHMDTVEEEVGLGVPAETEEFTQTAVSMAPRLRGVCMNQGCAPWGPNPAHGLWLWKSQLSHFRSIVALVCLGMGSLSVIVMLFVCVEAVLA